MLNRPGPSRGSAGSQAPFFADRRRSQIGRCQKFRQYFWNRQDHTVCNRTGGNWLKLTIFYLTFLTIIFGLLLVFLFVSTNILRGLNTPLVPKNNLAKISPGVGFHPNIVNKNSPLIWYNVHQQSYADVHAEQYVRYVDRFLAKYEDTENSFRYTDCTRAKRKPGTLCLFQKNQLGPCGAGDYGYMDKKPCFYLKLNKLRGWTPEFYETDDLPREMPRHLQNTVQNETYSKYIWVHCEGVNPHDQQHVGAISYFPKQGFMGDFFPYDGSKDYLPPLVAVKLDNIRPGFLVNIKCTSWAKNINRDVNSNNIEINFYLDIE